MTSLTPTEYRKQLDSWRERNSHLTDSEIIPDKPRIETPRHSGLCSDLKAMLAWRALYETRDPLATNFLQPGIDDEILFDDGSTKSVTRDCDSELEIRPTISEMTKLLSGVHFQERADGRRVPVGGDIEYGEPYYSERYGELRPVIRLGGLKFAQHDSEKRAGSLTFWKTGKYWRKPVDRSGRPKSGKQPSPPEAQRYNQHDGIAAMQELKHVNDNVSSADANVLSKAINAQNFKSVGEGAGYHGKTAERKGKQLVLQAVKSFEFVAEKLIA